MALIKDIRFWIVLFFAVRLYGITQPPLEIGHNWRQSTVAMVARNFYEGDARIAYPKIDIAGEKTGITGMEFPVFNYLIYGTSEVFGYAHWYGRLINLFFSSIGLWFFYLLIRRYFQSYIAFYSTIILLFSIWFRFSRKVMPDTFSMSFILAALYFGLLFLESKDRRRQILNLALFVATFAVGSLSKIPSAFLMVLFIPVYLQMGIPPIRKLVLAVAGAVVAVAVYYWYYVWVPHLVETYGFWHFFMGKSMSDGANELLLHWSDGLSNFYDKPLKFIGFVAVLFGLIFAFRVKDKKLIYIFTLAFAAFFVIMLMAGETFTKHDYYIIPFTPVLALCAGYGLNQIQSIRVRIVLLAAIVLELLGAQYFDFRIKPDYTYLSSIETELDSISSRNDLFLINSGPSPTAMYFAHRKGWVAKNNQITNPDYITNLRAKGLEYVLVLKQAFGTECYPNLPLILDKPEYKVYRVGASKNIHK